MKNVTRLMPQLVGSAFKSWHSLLVEALGFQFMYLFRKFLQFDPNVLIIHTCIFLNIVIRHSLELFLLYFFSSDFRYLIRLFLKKYVPTYIY